MPRNYQLKRKNDHYLPHDLYMQMVYVIRDYKRLKSEYEIIMHSSPFSDGMPKGTDTSDSTQRKAFKLISAGNELTVIDQTCVEMIGKYSSRVDTFKPLKAFHDYVYFSSTLASDDGLSERTWKRYRQEFAWSVARKLKKI